MNHSLTFTNATRSNDDDWFDMKLTINLGESKYSCNKSGLKKGDFFPKQEQISSWVKAIIYDDKTFDNISDFEPDDDEFYLDSLKMGIRHGNFLIDDLEIPYKLIKNDLIRFLRDLSGQLNGHHIKCSLSHTIKKIDNKYLDFDLKIEHSDTSSKQIYETYKFNKYGEINGPLFPKKEQINNWLKAIVSDDKTVADVFEYGFHNGSIDSKETLQMGLIDSYFFIDDLEISYNLIKKELILFLMELRDQLNSYTENSNSQSCVSCS